MTTFRSSRADNITRFKGYITHAEREKLHGHRGFALWFTGPSASGKSTIAHIVERELYEKGFSTYVFDGDNVRHGLCRDLGFSPEDRKENIRRIGEMLKLFVDAGIVALSAFISPFKADREWVRALLGPENFFEIYVNCPLEVCAGRDPKGLYKMATDGEIKEFTGISSPYEPPENPDITIYSDKTSAFMAAEIIQNYLRDKGILARKK